LLKKQELLGLIHLQHAIGVCATPSGRCGPFQRRRGETTDRFSLAQPDPGMLALDFRIFTRSR
jgi:hypothetical protein